MNGERRDFSIFKHAIGLVLLLGIGISVVIETLYVVYWGMDYVPYLFVCIAGLIIVTFFYGFQRRELPPMLLLPRETYLQWVCPFA